MPSQLHRALNLAVTFIALTSSTHAQIMAAPGAVAVPQGPTVTEHLTASVVNSVTGQPVAGVLVTSPGRPLAVLTDSQGHFPFDLTRAAQPAAGTSPMSLQLVFQLRKPGYLTRSALASVQSYAGAAVPSIELSIKPAASISGRIQSEDGILPPQVQVALFRHQVLQGKASWLQSQVVQTNSHGEYRFFDLLPGSYKVAAFTSAPENRGQTQAPSIAALLPAFYPNADTVDAASPIHAAAGESASANLTLRSAPLYRVVVPVVVSALHGRASAEKGPLQFNGVQPLLISHPLGFDLHYDSRINAVTGYLPSGSYDLRLLSGDPSAFISSATVHLNVAQMPVDTGPIALQPAAHVAMYVRWDSSTATSSDARPQYSYSFTSVEPGTEFQSRSRQRSNNSADPNTSAIDLTEGVYRFLLQPNRGYVASASSGATDLLREPLRVGPAQSPQPIQVSIREDVAALRIALTDPAGLDSTSATGLRSEQLAAILCIPLDQPAREPITQFILISSAVNSGTSFGNLAPGRYLVLASRQDDQIGFSPEYRNPDVLPTLLSKGVVVTLSPNDNASITVPLLPAEAQ